MSNHLSQDQLSMWILGRCTPEERQHGLDCPQCSAELARFQDPVSTFRAAFQDWSDRESAPQLQEVTTFLLKPRRFFIPSWSWAALGMAVVLLTSLPLYRQQEELMRGSTGQGQVPESTSVDEDALLMHEVRRHLSRTIPAPMEPIMALVPNPESRNPLGGIQ
jgi:anti-sigma factor RsiW